MSNAKEVAWSQSQTITFVLHLVMISIIKFVTNANANAMEFIHLNDHP
jgi:hypothetical protein